VRPTEKGLVSSCHDLSDGGLGVALAEMAFSGELGANIDLRLVPVDGTIKRDDCLLFSQSNSRFLCEVETCNQAEFEKMMHNLDYGCIGRVEKQPRMMVTGLGGDIIIDEALQNLKEAWQKPLRW
jgi:phosphoribosylformylglycinamidine synthase